MIDFLNPAAGGKDRGAKDEREPCRDSREASWQVGGGSCAVRARVKRAGRTLPVELALPWVSVS